MRKIHEWQWNTSDLPGEIWQSVPRFPSYQISNLGRVKRLGKPAPSIKKEMLLTVCDAVATLYKDGHCYFVPLARIMLEVFVGPPPSSRYVARHLDDDRTNNQLKNLAWGTVKQNAEDAVRNGRLPDQSGKTVSEETKAKLRTSNKIAHERNPKIREQHSTFVKKWFQEKQPIWITNGDLTKRIAHADPIPEGWRRGRL
jgi:hypothetical protein